MKSITDLSTPCYIFDTEEFKRGVTGFQKALDRHFPKNAIGYSVKTNSLHYAMRQARALGCMAEVVSYDEYNLARLYGYLPSEIIYNGPMKSKETFLEAVKGGAIVNIETKCELTWLEELPPDQIYSIGIRLNINISRVSPEDADGMDDNSRFGFSDQGTEFGDAIHPLRSLPNIRLAGLHIHRTAHSRSPRFYEKSLEYAMLVIEKYELPLDYLDIGGGYFGIFPNKPTFEDYSETFYSVLHRHGMSHVKVIVEPGNALTASPFKFLTEVIDVKRVDNRTIFVTTDGSRNDVDPFFRKTDYLKQIFRFSESRPLETLQIVAGCTCLEYDRLFRLDNEQRLEVGDRILYNNVGAYTMCLSPLFIRYFPKVYAHTGTGEYVIIRDAWTAENMAIRDK